MGLSHRAKSGTRVPDRIFGYPNLKATNRVPVSVKGKNITGNWKTELVLMPYEENTFISINLHQDKEVEMNEITFFKVFFNMIVCNLHTHLLLYAPSSVEMNANCVLLYIVYLQCNIT